MILSSRTIIEMPSNDTATSILQVEKWRYSLGVLKTSERMGFRHV